MKPSRLFRSVVVVGASAAVAGPVALMAATLMQESCNMGPVGPAMEPPDRWYTLIDMAPPEIDMSSSDGGDGGKDGL